MQILSENEDIDSPGHEIYLADNDPTTNNVQGNEGTYE